MGLGGTIVARAPMITLARTASLVLPPFRNPRYPSTPVGPRSQILSSTTSTERRAAAARSVSRYPGSVSGTISTSRPWPIGNEPSDPWNPMGLPLA